MRFKYFPLNCTKKDAIGIVNSPSLEKAFEAASIIKRLPLEDFKLLFGVEKI
jgi:hypothetical protein